MSRRRLASPAASFAACGLIAVLCAPSPLLAAAETPARSAVSDTPVAGVVRAPLQPQQFDGFPVALVFLDLYGSAGSPEADREIRVRLERAVQAIRAGTFNVSVADAAMGLARSIAGVSQVGYALYASERPGEIIFVLTATLSPPAATSVRGVLGEGSLSDLPVLYESDRALLRTTLNTGVGLYNDYNPWFASPATFTGRSPIALDPPGAGLTTWSEGWVEYGFSGASRLGDSPAYVYGEATGLTSASIGNDLFRSDARATTLVEKAYAGLLWVAPDSAWSARVAYGRQNWQLNSGFLFSKFSAGANAGPNPGLYLNPRTTFERALLAQANAGRLRAEYFDVDPAELKEFDSGTRFQGVHVWWLDAEGWDLGATAYQVRESRTTFPATGGAIPREGQQTWNLRVGHKNVAGIAGLAVLGEYAGQDHKDADVDAQAWYGQVGYTLRETPWKPTFSYRYASFSGDDPATATREAFDAPLSSGLDEWVQGVSFKKVVTNTNLNSHRVRLNLKASDRLSYNLDWFHLEADVPLATGERTYGEELDVVVRWSITKSLFFLGVAGVAWPGEIIEAQTQGAARPWTTIQASLFWGF